MNFRLYILSLFVMLGWTSTTAQDFRKTAPEPGPAPKIEIGDYETFKLENGLTGIVVENHKLPRVSLQLFFDLPLSGLGEGEKAGTAEIAGNLLGRGTTTRTKAEIDEAVDFIGASLNASATSISGASLTKHKDQLMEILADVTLHPSFPPEEFEKIKRQMLSALAVNKTDPDAMAGNLSNVLRYGSEHPYGEIKTEATVNNITLEDTKAYYETYFQPSIAYFVVIGDITANEAKKMASQYFKDWKGKPVQKKDFGQPEPPAATQVAFVDKPGAVQSVISITYPVGLTIRDPETLPVSVLNTILGGGASGRLFHNLREDKGYTYGASSRINPDRYVGYFDAGASVRNEVTDSSVVELLKEINTIREEAVSEQELQQAKNILAGSFARALEQPSTIARFAMNTVRYDLPEDYYATYLKRLSQVTQKDVMEAAEKYIKPQNAYILVVGNKGAVAEKLVRFDADGQLDFYDPYGQKIEIQDLELAGDMTAEAVIENYISAIGGRDRLNRLEDLTMNMVATVQGQKLETVMKRKAPGMMSMEMAMSGMVLMEQKFDGKKGKASQMGSPIPLDEAALAEMKNQAVIFPETQLAELGFQAELKGMEVVEGKKAYAVEMTSPAGSKSTDFYDISNGLKIRSVQESEGNRLISDYQDYREVEGIKFPFKTTITGMMPIPITMEVQSIDINTGLEKSEFSVE